MLLWFFWGADANAYSTWHYSPHPTKVRSWSKPDLTYLLTGREKHVIKTLSKEYKRRWGGVPARDKDLVYYLGDNANRRCWSAVSGRIPTLRMAGGLMWSVHLRRHMTGREKLLSLGFPVTKETAEAMRVPELPCRNVKRCSLIAGNAMHWSCVGIIQMIALCSFAIVRNVWLHSPYRWRYISTESSIGSEHNSINKESATSFWKGLCAILFGIGTALLILWRMVVGIDMAESGNIQTSKTVFLNILEHESNAYIFSSTLTLRILSYMLKFHPIYCDALWWINFWNSGSVLSFAHIYQWPLPYILRLQSLTSLSDWVKWLQHFPFFIIQPWGNPQRGRQRFCLRNRWGKKIRLRWKKPQRFPPRNQRQRPQNQQPRWIARRKCQRRIVPSARLSFPAGEWAVAVRQRGKSHWSGLNETTYALCSWYLFRS